MKSSRLSLSVILVVLVTILMGPVRAYGKSVPPAKKIPVILDTDIGDDIDDTWALVMMIKSPELDVKLVVGDNHKGIYRARIIAKMLEVAGRTDIPVGMAYSTTQGGGRQSDWIKDYALENYPGKIYQDGVGAIIDTINKSSEKITVIAIGPVPNLAQALKRDPGIAKKARFVGMHGSVRMGYGGNTKEIHAEYNVKQDVKSCQKVFTADWDMVITPLDTCGIIHLRGEKYAKIRNSIDPAAKALLENYRIWRRQNDEPIRTDETASSTLFDTVAIYLAFSDSLCNIEELPIVVDDEGYTRIKEGAKKMEVATSWKDLGKYEDLLVERIIGSTVKP